MFPATGISNCTDCRGKRDAALANPWTSDVTSDHVATEGQAMPDETYLVTGALGCIGAWVLKHLVERNAKAISADLSMDPVRPRLIMDGNQVGQVDWRVLDITDTEAVKALVAEAGVTRIIHLAGLQIPFCKANPPLGAAVNVLGTVNMFEAALASGTSGLVYASSLAALGPVSSYDS